MCSGSPPGGCAACAPLDPASIGVHGILDGIAGVPEAQRRGSGQGAPGRDWNSTQQRRTAFPPQSWRVSRGSRCLPSTASCRPGGHGGRSIVARWGGRRAVRCGCVHPSGRPVSVAGKGRGVLCCLNLLSLLCFQTVFVGGRSGGRSGGRACVRAGGVVLLQWTCNCSH